MFEITTSEDREICRIRDFAEYNDNGDDDKITEVKGNGLKQRTPAEVREPKHYLDRERMRTGRVEARLPDNDSLTCELNNQASKFVSDIFTRISNGLSEEE